MVRGRTTAPVGLVLGHEITGEVIQVGSDVEFIKVGDLVPFFLFFVFYCVCEYDACAGVRVVRARMRTVCEWRASTGVLIITDRRYFFFKLNCLKVFMYQYININARKVFFF